MRRPSPRAPRSISAWTPCEPASHGSRLHAALSTAASNECVFVRALGAQRPANRQLPDQRFAGVPEPNDEELENYRRQHAAEFARSGQQVDEVQLLDEAQNARDGGAPAGARDGMD